MRRRYFSVLDNEGLRLFATYVDGSQRLKDIYKSLSDKGLQEKEYNRRCYDYVDEWAKSVYVPATKKRLHYKDPDEKIVQGALKHYKSIMDK